MAESIVVAPQLSMSHASDMLWALAHNVTAQMHTADAPTRIDSTFNLADHSQHGKPPARASPQGKKSAGSSPTGPEVSYQCHLDSLLGPLSSSQCAICLGLSQNTVATSSAHSFMLPSLFLLG